MELESGGLGVTSIANIHWSHAHFAEKNLVYQKRVAYIVERCRSEYDSPNPPAEQPANPHNALGQLPVANLHRPTGL